MRRKEFSIEQMRKPINGLSPAPPGTRYPHRLHFPFILIAASSGGFGKVLVIS